MFYKFFMSNLHMLKASDLDRYNILGELFNNYYVLKYVYVHSFQNLFDSLKP